MDKDGEIGFALFYVGVAERQIIVTDNLADLKAFIPEFSYPITNGDDWNQFSGFVM